MGMDMDGKEEALQRGREGIIDERRDQGRRSTEVMDAEVASDGTNTLALVAPETSRPAKPVPKEF